MESTKGLAARGLWLLLILGSLLLVVSSASYLRPGIRHPFLIERMPLSLDGVWRMFLKIHVACGLLCLPAGLVLVARPMRERWPRLHRALGRCYVGAVVGLMVPTGIYLAPYSKYGWASGAGFLLSAMLLLASTLGSVLAARRKDAGLHREEALRSMAQIASAISFRFYHLAFQLCEMTYESSYIASVWLSVVGNAVLVEMWIRCFHERSHHETSSHTEHAVVGLVVER